MLQNKPCRNPFFQILFGAPATIFCLPIRSDHMGDDSLKGTKNVTKYENQRNEWKLFSLLLDRVLFVVYVLINIILVVVYVLRQ